MTDIEIVKYFNDHEKFENEVVINAAKEIVVKLVGKSYYFPFNFFTEIRGEIGRNFDIQFSRLDSVRLIIKCEDDIFNTDH